MPIQHTSTQRVPTIAISTGCSHGVGPEIVMKLVSQMCYQPSPPCTLRIYGDIDACNRMANVLKVPTLNQLVQESRSYIQIEPTMVMNEAIGQTSFRAIQRAVQDVARGECHGLVTGPVSKRSWWEAGVPYSGHTEALEALANQHWPKAKGSYQADMLFRYQKFTLLLLTRHIPLQQVSKTLTFETALGSMENLIRYIQPPLDESHPQGFVKQHIAMLGLNPHAAEIGGEEERTVLEPLRCAIEQRWPRVTVSSPFPADAFFRGFDAAYAKGFDAVVSPYHDQGLIPMKLLGGYGAVNITIGLPFSRTSVSHGTGEDIAGQCIANPEGLRNALNYMLEHYHAMDFSGA